MKPRVSCNFCGSGEHLITSANKAVLCPHNLALNEQPKRAYSEINYPSLPKARSFSDMRNSSLCTPKRYLNNGETGDATTSEVTPIISSDLENKAKGKTSCISGK